MLSRKRKANFSPQEQESLINAVNENIGDIQNRNQGEAFKKSRTEAWRKVLTAVNANCCAAEPRTLAEIQKKYSELKSAVKKRMSQIAKAQTTTGGGGPSQPPLTPLETCVSQSIEKEEVFGIDGGIEPGLSSSEVVVSEVRVSHCS